MRRPAPAKAGDGRPAAAMPGVEVARKEPDWDPPIDPDGDCKIDLDRDGKTIRIAVPGTPHVLAAELERRNAPRVLRDVGGDFEARVQVTGVFHPAGRTTAREYAPYHGAGILLWQDGDNYVRLEIAADVHRGKRRPYANFEYRKDGVLAVSRGMLITDDTSFLRLRRRGDEVEASFGRGGDRWTSFPRLATRSRGR